MRSLRIASVLAALLALAACAQLPVDPNGTLHEVRSGTLVVGAFESEPWVKLAGDEPTGVEPELVRQFAGSLGAEVEWVLGAEHELVEQLAAGELHLVIGGVEEDTPWSSKAALTRPYLSTEDERGVAVRHVFLAQQGENAFLLELDRFLLSQDPQ